MEEQYSMDELKMDILSMVNSINLIKDAILKIMLNITAAKGNRKEELDQEDESEHDTEEESMGDESEEEEEARGGGVVPHFGRRLLMR
jgi:ribosomal protein L12E/L44/L45/RPP1/RPP2